jgi:hypothetical protein
MNQHCHCQIENELFIIDLSCWASLFERKLVVVIIQESTNFVSVIRRIVFIVVNQMTKFYYEQATEGLAVATVKR